VINCPDFTWVVYPGMFMQLLFSCRQKPPKNPMQKLPKNPTKIQQKPARQKSFMISLTKNLLKTLNISKNFLILHSTQTKQKSHAPPNYTI
jgi:hypothetical protein